MFEQTRPPEEAGIVARPAAALRTPVSNRKYLHGASHVLLRRPGWQGHEVAVLEYLVIGPDGRLADSHCSASLLRFGDAGPAAN